jgi:hypothetical protein
VDIEALEKEVCIDIAELRRDLRALRRDLYLPPDPSTSLGETFLEKPRKSSETSYYDGGRKHSGRLQLAPFFENIFDSRQKSFISETSVPEEEEAATVSGESPKLVRKSFHAKSFKTDNNPELVTILKQNFVLETTYTVVFLGG